MVSSAVDWQLFAQPILRVDSCTKYYPQDYELLIRDASGRVPLQQLQRLLGSEEGNYCFWGWKRNVLRPLMEEHQVGMPSYWINIDPVQLAFDSTWQFLQDFSCYRDTMMIEVTERPIQDAATVVDLPVAIHQLHQLGY
ncbi:hypothetical protein [Limosilactobacillus kribbianus]|uniref:hypothetical protein n=1 Tax=Limosilactobacillus kribbianus TaxID=2982695 RepID=UPI002263B0FA|nr:hypothetical protein [Limosilactobacillus kribbianus]